MDPKFSGITNFSQAKIFCNPIFFTYNILGHKFFKTQISSGPKIGPKILWDTNLSCARKRNLYVQYKGSGYVSQDFQAPLFDQNVLEPLPNLTFIHQVLFYLGQSLAWNSSVALISLTCFVLNCSHNPLTHKMILINKCLIRYLFDPNICRIKLTPHPPVE